MSNLFSFVYKGDGFIAWLAPVAPSKAELMLVGDAKRRLASPAGSLHIELTFSHSSLFQEDPPHLK